jgi:hypothetical protein
LNAVRRGTHLGRYVTGFEFRFKHRTDLGASNVMRAEAVLKGIEGKRLTYRRLDQTEELEAAS